MMSITIKSKEEEIRTYQSSLEYYKTQYADLVKEKESMTKLIEEIQTQSHSIDFFMSLFNRQWNTLFEWIGRFEGREESIEIRVGLASSKAWKYTKGLPDLFIYCMEWIIVFDTVLERYWNQSEKEWNWIQQ